MTTAPSPKRAACANCLRPQSACICRWIAPVQAQAELLILQHPLEVSNAKNTARLLHLSVKGSVMVVGEAFDPASLDALLHAGGRSPLLLYPDTPGAASRGVASPLRSAEPSFPRTRESHSEPQPGTAAGLRLVVLDATWRKSRKMLYLNALLQGLPRLALRDMPASAYRIRKAHAPDQLSTLEASVHALAQLEGDFTRFQPLLAAFDGFVAQQAAYAHA